MGFLAEAFGSDNSLTAFQTPHCPVSGSAIPGIERTSDYVVRVLMRLQKDRLRSVSVKPEAQSQFIRWVQSRMPEMSWSDPCKSWCKLCCHHFHPLSGRVISSFINRQEWQGPDSGSMAGYTPSLLRCHWNRSLGRFRSHFRRFDTEIRQFWQWGDRRWVFASVYSLDIPTEGGLGCCGTT